MTDHDKVIKRAEKMLSHTSPDCYTIAWGIDMQDIITDLLSLLEWQPGPPTQSGLYGYEILGQKFAGWISDEDIAGGSMHVNCTIADIIRHYRILDPPKN